MEPNKSLKFGCGYATERDLQLYVQLKLDPAVGVVMSRHFRNCVACRIALNTIRQRERSLTNPC
jgi:hypothetical protein